MLCGTPKWWRQRHVNEDGRVVVGAWKGMVGQQPEAQRLLWLSSRRQTARLTHTPSYTGFRAGVRVH